MVLSFHRLCGLLMRRWKRRSCSSSLTDSQYFTSVIPDRISARSNCGQWRMNSSYSAWVQKPMTRSTPARLYQLRSNSAISPAAGRWATYRWKYHWLFSRSVGAGAETAFVARGLVSAVRESEGLRPLQATLIQAMCEAMTGHTVDPASLAPIDAAAFAEGLRRRNAIFRTRILHLMLIGMLVLVP